MQLFSNSQVEKRRDVVNILLVSGFILFVGLAARNFAVVVSRRGLADRIHKTALIGEIMLVSLSGFLALVKYYAPVYLFVAGVLAYLVSHWIVGGHGLTTRPQLRKRHQSRSEFTVQSASNVFAFSFVTGLAVGVLAWNVIADFSGPMKRTYVGDDASYHLPIAWNLQIHRSLWFPPDDYLVVLPEIGVRGSASDRTIYLGLNHELLVSLAWWVVGPYVEFLRLVNYMLMGHLMLLVYCYAKLVIRSNSVSWLVALAVFLLPVFQGRLLLGQISVFMNLKNDLFLTLMVLSAIYVVLEQWRDVDSDQNSNRIRADILLVSIVSAIAIGTKWYALLYVLLPVLSFGVLLILRGQLRLMNSVRLWLLIAGMGIVNNGAIVRNILYFGDYTGGFGQQYGVVAPIGHTVLTIGNNPLAGIRFILLAWVTHGGGLGVIFPLITLWRVGGHWLRPPNSRWPLQITGTGLVLGTGSLLYGLVAIATSAIFFLIPASRVTLEWLWVQIRYAMPAFVLSQLAVLSLRAFGKLDSPTSQMIVPLGVCLSVVCSLFMYFLPVHVAVLVALSLGAGLVGVVAQRVRYERVRVND